MPNYHHLLSYRLEDFLHLIHRIFYNVGLQCIHALLRK